MTHPIPLLSLVLCVWEPWRLCTTMYVRLCTLKTMYCRAMWLFRTVWIFLGTLMLLVSHQRGLGARGFQGENLWQVFRATTVSYLIYAAPAWWGYTLIFYYSFHQIYSCFFSGSFCLWRGGRVCLPVHGIRERRWALGSLKIRTGQNVCQPIHSFNQLVTGRIVYIIRDVLLTIWYSYIDIYLL